MNAQPERALTIFLCGDVMTGRGVDQVLPHPGIPTLHESFVLDARDYVELAERKHGSIPRPVSFDYIWGDAISEWKRAQPDVRIINLETSITSSERFWREKGIHYRMHPRNVDCLTAARIDACSLANNHVLDWGYAGLTETLETLDRAGVAHAGAGRNAAEAAAPAILKVPNGRVLLFSLGSITSGIPPEWAATDRRAGVNLLKDLSEATAQKVLRHRTPFQQPGDVVIASIHWGDNWGYEVSQEQVNFAHRLIEGGVAIVHGHSSHHVKGLEVYRGGLILYGCGDFLSDYEGISGLEAYRGDLALMYLVQVEPGKARLTGAQLVPLQVRGFRLHRASAADVRWLQALLDELGRRFDTHVRWADEQHLEVELSRG